MAQKTGTQPRPAPAAIDADARPPAAQRHDADPPLRGEGRRGLCPRQDRRLSAPLHRRGGGGGRRHLGDAARTTTRSRPTASTATAWPRAPTPAGRWPSCSGASTGSARARAARCTCSTRAINFLGGHAIVGGHLPLATGVGFAIKYRGGDQVIACYFGDGAVPEGEFHESMNLAALWKLPVIFICENNRYAMGTSLERALAETEIWKFGRAYNMPCEAVDGMDVLAVREVMARAVARARTEHAPTLIEARTYRFRGHSMRDPAGRGVPHQGRGREGEAARPHRAVPRARAQGRLAGGGRRPQASRRTSTTWSTRRWPSPTPRPSRRLSELLTDIFKET